MDALQWLHQGDLVTQGTAAVLLAMSVASWVVILWRIWLLRSAVAGVQLSLPVFWQSAAVQRIGAARTVLIGTLGPMLTIFFAWLLLTEPVSIAQLLGAGLVLAGVLLVSRRQRPRAVQRGSAGK